MTAWDFSSGVFIQDKILSSPPTGLFFRADGLKMYHCKFADNNTLEYDLSVPFDVSTAVLAFQFGAGGNDIFFKSDGTTWFRLLSNGIQGFNTVTPWRLSGSTVGSFKSLPEDDFHESVFFTDDGLIMYTVGAGNSTEGSSDRVYRYNLSIAFDITTAVFTQSFHVVENLPTGIFFKSDGTRMFILGAEDNSLSNDSTMWEYPLTVPFDISSTTSPIETDITTHDTYPRGLHFTPNGSKAFFGGVQNDKVYQFDLAITTPDINKEFFVDALIQQIGENITCSIEQSFSEDFPYIDQPNADLSWVPNDSSKMRVNIANNNLDFNSVMDGTNDAIVHDLGIINSTEWTLRFKLRFSSLVQGGSGPDVVIGISSTDQTNSAFTNQDWFGFAFLRNVFVQQWNVSVSDNNFPPVGGGGTNDSIGGNTAGDPILEILVINTDYFIEVKRDGQNFETSIYPDATYTTPDNTSAVIGASTLNPQNLRYIKVMNRPEALSSGTCIGTIDDITLISSASGQGCFTIDARLRGRKDFTIDATLSITDAVGLILDALLTKEGNIKDFIIDGIIKGLDIDKTFLVDGLPFIPPAILFSVNGLIQELDKTVDFFIDARIRQGNDAIFLIDGLPKGANIEITLIDARIVQTKLRMFGVDARISPIKEFIVDGTLKIAIQEIVLDVESVLGQEI